ncbi:hypothetical protein NUSPORA_00287 [Nucleospora cyclopteri]
MIQVPEQNIVNLYNNEKQSEIIRRFLQSKESTEIKVVSQEREMLEALEASVEATGAILAGKQNHEEFEDEIRQLIKVTISSTKYCYEGEVTDIKNMEDKIEIRIMTSKETQTLILPKYLSQQISHLRIGDIVYSEPSLGIIKRIGRSEKKVNEYDLEGNKYVPLPKGSVLKVKEKDFVLSLYEIDCSFNNGDNSISNYTRNRTDEFVNKMLEERENNFVSDTLIIIKSADDLTNSEKMIIEMYSEYNFVKFILLGREMSVDFLTVKLNNEIADASEYLRFLLESRKSIKDDKFVDAAKEYVTLSNVGLICNLIEVSDTIEELIGYLSDL